MGGVKVRKSVLEAIRDGVWDFEPAQAGENEFDATRAMPGTREKVDVMAQRIREGLPLWHSRDRSDFEEEFES